MTQHSFPWNDVNGDRLYDADDFMRFFAAFLKTGVVMSFKDGLRVRSAQNGMNIQVGGGSGVIDGGSYMNDETIAIQINVASSVQDRTDSVVLRMDKNARDTYLYYKPGDTTVVRNDIIFELQLAKISVKMNTAQITDADITDMRSDPTVCGWSTPFDNINVDGIVDQYKGIFAQADVEFQAWFQNLKDQLDDNQAANLQNQINVLKSDKADRNEVVHLTGDEDISGHKNFTEGLSVSNNSVYGVSMNNGWYEERLGDNYYRWTQIFTVGANIAAATGSLYNSDTLTIPAAPTGAVNTNRTVTISVAPWPCWTGYFATAGGFRLFSTAVRSWGNVTLEAVLYGSKS